MDDAQYNVLVSYWNNPKTVVQCVKSDTILLYGFLYMQVPNSYRFQRIARRTNITIMRENYHTVRDLIACLGTSTV